MAPGDSRHDDSHESPHIVTTESHEENVGRFLNKSLLDDKAARGLARARIRGLEDLSLVTAWESVERSLSRGPRSTVLEWLDERRADLREERRLRFAEYLEGVDKRANDTHESVARFYRDEPGGGLERVAADDRRTPVTSERASLERWKNRRAARADGGEEDSE